MTSPRVSVVITAYNRPEFLKGAIESVMAQTFRDFELIIIDDCSPTELFASCSSSTLEFASIGRSRMASFHMPGIRASGSRVANILRSSMMTMNGCRPSSNNRCRPCGVTVRAYAGSRIWKPARRPFTRYTRSSPEMLLYRNKFGGPTGFLCKTEHTA